ncbi:hypothetical protein CNR22_19455 [Sphingobacteriaceae bacterium]|nr:hypothetical protein CNR22_19455 [Sphingobacteriaceae bacterium]
MKKINNITVGIDFSENSVNAFHYARSFARSINASLTLVHVKESPVIVSDVMIPSFPPEDNESLVKELEKIIAQENSATEKVKEIKIKILTGNAVSTLSELPENTGTDILILGTTGLSKVMTTLLGSTSLKISNQAHCPVILVPSDAKWQAISQVMFASDYDSLTSVFVNKITEFAQALHTNVHFVNVRNYDPILEPKQKDIDWSGLLQSYPANLAYKKSTVYGNDTVAELQNYCASNTIQLMAFASKHRNFWANLTHKSITAKMALSTQLPMMVMHLDDEV